MTQITTIKLHKETKQRLDRLKEYNRESYEEVLRKILFILNLSRKNPEKAGLMLERLDVAVRRKNKRYSEVYYDETEDNLPEIPQKEKPQKPQSKLKINSDNTQKLKKVYPSNQNKSKQKQTIINKNKIKPNF